MRLAGPGWVRVASAVHRLMLGLASRPFRRDFGRETDAAFVQLVTDIGDRQGPRAAAWAALEGITDTARAVLADHMDEWRARTTSGLWLDVVRAARLYRRAPVLTGAITLVLAVAGGPVVALIAVLYQGILAPLPYPESDRLVVITHNDFPFLRGWSVSDYRNVTAFAQVSGVRPVGGTVTFDGRSQRIGTYQVSAGTLSMLGVPFAAGRDLRIDDEEVVVVTRAFAERHFGSATAALGQQLELINSRSTIIGVADVSPRLPRASGLYGTQVFRPHPAIDRPDLARQDRRTQAIVIARLRAGVSHAEAEHEVRSVAAGVAAQYGEELPAVGLESLRTATAGPVLVPMLLLLGLGVALFFLAATSLASLVLARSASNVPAFILRRSLGASRWRLIRGWLAEGLALSLPGALIAAWLAGTVIPLTASLLPPGVIAGLDRFPLSIGLTGAGALWLMAGSLFAVAPIAAGVLRGSMTSVARATYTTTRRRASAQTLLIVGQVAASVLAVSVSLWLSSELYRVLSRPLGFDPEGLVTVLYQSPQGSVESASILSRVSNQLDLHFGEASVTRGSAIPGLNTAGFVPHRVRADQGVLPEEARPVFVHMTIEPDYFSVVGIEIVEGRPFTQADAATPQSTIIVSRSLAARWFPDGAVGQRVNFGERDDRLIVGVTADVHADSLLKERANPAFYTLASDSLPSGGDMLAVRTDRPVRDVEVVVRQVLGQLDPAAMSYVLPAEDAMGLILGPRRLMQMAVVALALLALALAVVNIWALSAWSVIERSREFGVRLALGATHVQAVRLAMRRGLGSTVCGLATGALVTLVFARPAIRSQIANLATPEWLMAVALAVVALFALVGCWLPARSASHIEPAAALRAD